MNVNCPWCNKLVNIPDQQLGQVVKCPCGQLIKTRVAASSTPIPQAQQSLFDVPPTRHAANQVSPLFAAQLQQIKSQQFAKQETQATAAKPSPAFTIATIVVGVIAGLIAVMFVVSNIRQKAQRASDEYNDAVKAGLDPNRPIKERQEFLRSMRD